ncbi:MAG TPA: flavodoxin-dependent (E)-4-hydroxy-3-methylbut-2-enyl-diphosphate synthase [Halanaerobiales bacterium]|nr:flavodoxin-dependent (E)-4-hydroxy-3-methylbut-2-enyl-diphosphate synthase [Halanaerobiales bacterium]HPZ62566.1 flavodoxin-dependent (E)-4-hydroxy-3-methylbut-2-enyl-diphosphate synthase [Halanaerobiales bacterium]HQD03138.1 flavodoxin-dependent (E)-4-hydroxy-3-methylbut-2-enyl-diphosphate synthase [Halanaerobiales bacterium]
MRRKTRKIYYGNVPLGGDAPITVQSMTTTKTADVEATVKQIQDLSAAGCEIIRVAVPDLDSAKQLGKIREQIDIPLIADIHFDYRLALEAIEQGVEGLRLNPGNIGQAERVKEIATKARAARIPIRIGVNSGSIEKGILEKYGGPTAEGMVESALGHIRILEDNDFQDIVISLKATDVMMTIRAYELMAERVDYPFHIGITEAGTIWAGTIKSAVGVGALLSRGIGDTVRVSLTGDPLEEVKVGWQILKALRLRKRGAEIISCPTCGRNEIDLISLAKQVEDLLDKYDKEITVAVMGCVVNGPGEAREADIGIAGGRGVGLIFRKGEIIKKVPEDKLLEELEKEINLL